MATDRTPQQILVAACPQCGSVYTGQDVHLLGQQQNRRSSMRNAATEDPSKWGEVVGTRLHCQICAQHGITVERRLLTYTLSSQ